MGFSAVDNTGIIPSGEDTEANLDDNFKLVFKKFLKKDPITRKKGLQELQELVEAADVETVKLILPAWVKYYTNLSSEVDYGLREASQQCHSVVVAKVGKNIAPVLKALAGPWIASLFDTYAVAASIAKNSYEKSFPTLEKQQKMLVFCEQELLEYFTKNLLTLTPATVFGSK